MRYLLISYYKKPDGQIDESTAVSQNLKKLDIQTCNVILDFKTLSVLKCSMNGTQVPRDFNRIVEYYMKHYPNVIERLFNENGYQIDIKTDPVEEK